MTKQDIINKFIDKPSYLGNGAGRLSKMWDTTRETIIEAKAEAREQIREDAVPEGFVLTSMWGSAENPMKSYKKIGEDSSMLEEFKDDLFAELEDKGEVKPYTMPKKQTGRLLEISIPDFHFGKIGGLTIEEQGKLFIAAGLQMYESAKVNNITRVVLPVGNDLLNSEHTLTTTRGTKQENNTPFHKMFVVAWTSIVKLVDIIQTEVPVDIIIVPGNHDENANIMLGEVLYAYYRNNGYVHVDNEDASTKYFVFGRNLFLYNHGDKIKHDALALRMAVEQPILFAKCPYRFVRLGHYHAKQHSENMGIEITVLPSLANADKWHKDHNYISKPKAESTVFDVVLGKVGTSNIYLEHIKY